MNCKAAQSKLSAYLDRELTGTELFAIRDHLHACEACQVEENELRRLKAMLGGLSLAEPPADLADRLCASVLGAAQPVAPRSRWQVPVLTFGTVAVCSMIATLIFVTPGNVTPSAKAPDEDTRYNAMQERAYSIGFNATEGSPVSSVSDYATR